MERRSNSPHDLVFLPSAELPVLERIRRLSWQDFEEFIADRRGFFNSLLDQAGIPNAAFKDPELPAGAAHLFRRGLVDEWRTIMDASQARKATDAVPTQLWSLFRWKP